MRKKKKTPRREKKLGDRKKIKARNTCVSPRTYKKKRKDARPLLPGTPAEGEKGDQKKGKKNERFGPRFTRRKGRKKRRERQKAEERIDLRAHLQLLKFEGEGKKKTGVY